MGKNLVIAFCYCAICIFLLLVFQSVVIGLFCWLGIDLELSVASALRPKLYHRFYFSIFIMNW